MAEINQEHIAKITNRNREYIVQLAKEQSTTYEVAKERYESNTFAKYQDSNPGCRIHLFDNFNWPHGFGRGRPKVRKSDGEIFY